MSTRHDPVQVLRHLADTLDVEQTLAAFPGMSRKALADILHAVTGMDEKPPSTAILAVDGAARGNPGQAGAGIVLLPADGSAHRFGEYLGEATNNVAEYRAMLIGMQKAADLGIRDLLVRSDSELIVKQIKGLYKVKSPHLQDLRGRRIRTRTGWPTWPSTPKIRLSYRLMRLAIAHHLLRSQSRVILEVPSYVRLRSHAPSGLASKAL
jgi:ribonuclease HI